MRTNWSIIRPGEVAAHRQQPCQAVHVTASLGSLYSYCTSALGCNVRIVRPEEVPAEAAALQSNA
jgi:hypothetical protein